MKIDLPRSGRLSLLLRAVVTLSIFIAIFYVLPVAKVWEAMTQVGWLRWLVVFLLFVRAGVEETGLDWTNHNVMD